MTQKHKLIQFKPLLFKEKLRKIWKQYEIYLDFEREWKNFLNICDNNKPERIFALNNFLITEFLIVYCGLNPNLLKETNCYCDNTIGKIRISNKIYKRKKTLIEKFISNFN